MENNYFLKQKYWMSGVIHFVNTFNGLMEDRWVFICFWIKFVCNITCPVDWETPLYTWDNESEKKFWNYYENNYDLRDTKSFPNHSLRAAILTSG